MTSMNDLALPVKGRREKPVARMNADASPCFVLFGRPGGMCITCGTTWRYGDVFLGICPRKIDRDGGRS